MRTVLMILYLQNQHKYGSNKTDNVAMMPRDNKRHTSFMSRDTFNNT